MDQVYQFFQDPSSGLDVVDDLVFCRIFLNLIFL